MHIGIDFTFLDLDFASIICPSLIYSTPNYGHNEAGYTKSIPDMEHLIVDEPR